MVTYRCFCSLNLTKCSPVLRKAFPFMLTTNMSVYHIRKRQCTTFVIVCRFCKTRRLPFVYNCLCILYMLFFRGRSLPCPRRAAFGALVPVRIMPEAVHSSLRSLASCRKSSTLGLLLSLPLMCSMNWNGILCRLLQTWTYSLTSFVWANYRRKMRSNRWEYVHLILPFFLLTPSGV